MSNILGNMPPVFGSGYRGVVPAPSAADVSAQNILRADGTWGATPGGAIPSQTGNAGKLLTTDGTNASWASSLNTFQFGDVTLGSSGPSVKSTLSARAPRQGLVFDGTSNGTIASVPAFGTGDFTFAAVVAPSASASANQTVIAGSNGALYLAIKTDGTIAVAVNGSAFTGNSTSTVTFGKNSLIAYTRSGTTGTFYINGVASGTITDSGNYSVAVTNLSYGAGVPFIGTIESPLIYNRALSASEVVALYEAGAPAGADYGTSSNAPSTNAITNAARNSTFTAGGTDWAGASGGAVTSGGAITITPTFSSRVELANGYNTIRSGYRYRITVSVTGFTAGTDPVVIRGALIGGTNVTINGNGTFTVPDFTSNTSTAYLQFINLTGTGSGSNCTFTVTSIVVTTLGLLLAPDAAQAGGGLVWYDTSGNAANITLPASGVTWNVPSSRVLGGNWTTSGSLGVGASTPTGKLEVAGAGGSVAFRITRDASNVLDVYQGGGINYIDASAASAQIAFLTSGSEKMRLFNNGNLFVGASPVDGGQKLQVSGTARVSNSISVENNLTLTTTSNPRIYWNSGQTAWIDYTSDAWTFRHGGTGTTSLSLDSNGNATVAGTVTSTGTLKAVTNLALTTVSGYNFIGFNNANNLTTATGIYSATGDTTLYLNVPTSSTIRARINGVDKLTVSETTATFANSIAIGNTVQTAVGVASTHKVTISIGGSTYYLLATNV